ncbi:tRNA (adenosine(37)-N6)-threonylcarbamoyltransferase complex ATPase subunit type 1 TsaE [Hydrogenophaga sp. RWCD_12]|uniref:tRNA (adenosine(37)-N6)-threonylcarbamoyltransferase complex ATPase subunit type 1 TsaE n=1 Tax=Hydrogenophaga sp. RWCD_12 TaxID=3391190 RepID=UPI0039846D3E
MESGSHLPPIVGTPAPAEPLARWDGRWADEAGTAAFAQRLAACPAITRATITLAGDLGAGKTTFVRHLLRALGVTGRIKSPTYAVVEPHRAEAGPHGPLSAWHFDFYRFGDPREWEDAGFRELFASAGLKLVEWPERAAGLMPAVDAALDIGPEETPGDESDGTDAPRRVTMQAFTDTGRQLLAALAP